MVKYTSPKDYTISYRDHKLIQKFVNNAVTGRIFRYGVGNPTLDFPVESKRTPTSQGAPSMFCNATRVSGAKVAAGLGGEDCKTPRNQLSRAESRIGSN